MKIFCISILLLVFSLGFGQKHSDKDILIAYVDSTGVDNLTGYKNLAGEIIIKAKYYNGSDTLSKMAIIQTMDFEFVGINKNDSIILKPYIYDNGPDYVEDGLFRFRENGLVGFANLDGEKIIPAKYTFADYFKEGLAFYAIGGEPVYENGKTKSEIIKESGYEGLADLHWTWGGKKSESGYLNKFGQEFNRVSDLKNNRRQVWDENNKMFTLDKNGRIIR